jgi:hypothetical protein
MLRTALLVVIVAALAGAGCARARAPAELSGLWSSGPAACAAGVGVRFRANAIAVVYDEQTETLFRRPRYEVFGESDPFRVRITYELPQVAGGVRVAGARGVMVLIRGPDGAIAPTAHSLIDARTGSARVRFINDPAVRALTLRQCQDGAWPDEDLRGRSA